MPARIGPYWDVTSWAPAGALRDGTVDWTTYIQAAIDYIKVLPISGSVGNDSGTLFFPPGRYKITSPLIIAPSSGYCSVSFLGDTQGYGANSFHGSAIICAFANKDQAALILQSVRAVCVENIIFIGQNPWTMQTGRNPTDMNTHYDDANYVMPGVRDNRKSPHAAIAVDPFAAGIAASDQYPGLSAKYAGGLGGSSAIRVRGVEMRDFVVGFALSLNGVTQNAEDVFLEQVTFVSVKSALAIGQSQSRNVTVSSFSALGARTVFDCVNYGTGNGSAPSIFGGNVNGVKYIFQTSSIGGCCSVTGVIAENLWSIGVIGGGSSVSDPASFSGCRFKFAATPLGRKAIPFRFANLGITHFAGCAIAVKGSDEPMWMVNHNHLTFSTCGFHTGAPDHTSRLWINGVKESVFFDNCDMSVKYGAVISQSFVITDMGNIYDYLMLPGTSIQSTDDGLGRRYVSAKYPTTSIGTVDVTVAAGGTATFTAPAEAAGKLAKGDFVYDLSSSWHVYGAPYASQPTTVIIGKVETVVGALVTLKHVPDYVPTGVMVAQALYARYLPRVHRPTPGTATAGSADVIIGTVNVAYWKAHEHIRDREGRFPEGTYVVTVGVDKLTLSTAAGSTGPVNLHDADLKEFTMTNVA